MREISLLFEAAGTGSGIVSDVPASMIGNGGDIQVAAGDALLMETGNLFRTDYTSTDTVLGESERESKDYLYDASTDTLSEGCPIVLRRAVGEISEEDCESSVCSEWGSGPVECRTDCDCGRCWYCEEIGGENGVCRYGGEGPAGCFRGCSG
ncbi:MAG TPA: hypothetical protein RMG48_00735 [Myxococcales bacterium LLY-WYZ-16_1]|nr:hypothetical protein [Myxococcales bacterium LLY-WYZ-16_1]